MKHDTAEGFDYNSLGRQSCHLALTGVNQKFTKGSSAYWLTTACKNLQEGRPEHMPNHAQIKLSFQSLAVTFNYNQLNLLICQVIVPWPHIQRWFMILTSAMLFLKLHTHTHADETVLSVHLVVSGQIHVVVKAVRTIYEINICTRNFYWQKED